MSSHISQAIQTALIGDWEKAIELNKEILKEYPDDINTLNRLGFAMLSVGNHDEAKSLYEKVLSLDMKNPIAQRNLKRINSGNNLKANITLNNLFIEETGKTKIIELLNIADKKVLSHLRSGEKVLIKIKRNKIFALDQDEKFLGMFPDDICKRLIEFINGGNEYDAYVWNIADNKISVFIREIKRVKKFINQPSFLSNEKQKIKIKKQEE